MPDRLIAVTNSLSLRLHSHPVLFSYPFKEPANLVLLIKQLFPYQFDHNAPSSYLRRCWCWERSRYVFVGYPRFQSSYLM